MPSLGDEKKSYLRDCKKLASIWFGFDEDKTTIQNKIFAQKCEKVQELQKSSIYIYVERL